MGLRAIVRQDPDVILVGEIRDQETAAIAIQAALTGHLVFSTLHTNDAAGTIARLLSLKASPANVSAALNLIIAQRLVRIVCKVCTETRNASTKELAVIKKRLQKLANEAKVKIPLTFKMPAPKGCKDCNKPGYKGNVGIFEQMVTSDAL